MESNVKYVLGPRGVTVHHPNGFNEFHKAGTDEYDRLRNVVQAGMPKSGGFSSGRYGSGTDYGYLLPPWLR